MNDERWRYYRDYDFYAVTRVGGNIDWETLGL